MTSEFDSSAAPHNCPGPESSTAGRLAPCAGCPNKGLCSSGAAAEGALREKESALEVLERLTSVRRFVLVMSGKGGVGKSTVASLLARQLASDQQMTGLVDIDLCGPSVATMMGAEGERVRTAAVGWQPVSVGPNLVCASSAFLLASLNDALVWRGPRKTGLITQLLRDVDWGDLDVLVIDTPPGTSDEHLAIARFLPLDRTVAVLVSTPQPVALAAVRKQVEFCQRLGIPILGFVENMTSFICPCCGHETNIFPSAPKKHTEDDTVAMTLDKLAAQTNIPVLVHIPLDESITQYCDSGECPEWLCSPNYEGRSKPVQAAFIDLAKKVLPPVGDGEEEEMK